MTSAFIIDTFDPATGFGDGAVVAMARKEFGGTVIRATFEPGVRPRQRSGRVAGVEDSVVSLEAGVIHAGRLIHASVVSASAGLGKIFSHSTR